jgi:hypothetical protein
MLALGFASYGLQAQNCTSNPCNMICNKSFEEGISLLSYPSFADIAVRLNGSTCSSGKIIKQVTAYPNLTLPPAIQFKRVQCLFFPYVNVQPGAQTYEWSISPSFTNFFSSTTPTTLDLAFEEHETVDLYLRTRNVCGLSPVRSVHKTMGNVPGNCMQKMESEFKSVEAEISIFPNPAENELQIRLLNFESSSYIIYDLLGNVVAKNSISNGDNILDISGLSKGLYAIRFSNYKTLTFIKKLRDVKSSTLPFGKS